MAAFLAAYLASGIQQAIHRGTWQILGFAEIGQFSPRLEKSHRGDPLQAGDRILSVDGSKIRRAADWYRITEKDSRPGQTLTIRLIRSTEQKQVQVTVPQPQWWYPLSWAVPLIPLAFWLICSRPVESANQA